jgi:hypothetical protein
MSPPIFRHVLSSVDAKIDGAALGAVTASGDHEATGTKLEGDAWLCGRTTMQQHFAEDEPFVSGRTGPRDVLWMDGEDLRSRPLIERKRLLRTIVPEQPSAMLYADHIERTGIEFFRLACERDLEGIVAKFGDGAYGERWFKIRNPHYSQYEGRRELFEKRPTGLGAASAGRS